MKISCCASTEQPQRISLLIDGEPWRDVHPAIFGSKPKLLGADLKECKEKFDELEYKGAKRFMLKRLSLKSYYSGELESALSERLVSPSTTAKVIDEFTQLGYLNDCEWIKSTILRLQRQKCGPRAIAMKLYAKGIDKETARAAIESYCDDAAQQENIHRLLASRYRSRNLADPKEKQKVVAALMRKGYALNQIFEAL